LYTLKIYDAEESAASNQGPQETIIHTFVNKWREQAIVITLFQFLYWTLSTVLGLQ
jgi:hypothetical protein